MMDSEVTTPTARAEGFYFEQGRTGDYVQRPASLAGVGDAFALYVQGDSMAPRWFAGELVYCNPNIPLTKECFVAVELHDGRGLLKQYLRRDGDQVVLRQFNPALDIRVAASDVRAIHRIVGSSSVLSA